MADLGNKFRYERDEQPYRDKPERKSSGKRSKRQPPQIKKPFFEELDEATQYLQEMQVRGQNRQNSHGAHTEEYDRDNQQSPLPVNFNKHNFCSPDQQINSDMAHHRRATKSMQGGSTKLSSLKMSRAETPADYLNDPIGVDLDS